MVIVVVVVTVGVVGDLFHNDCRYALLPDNYIISLARVCLDHGKARANVKAYWTQ